MKDGVLRMLPGLGRLRGYGVREFRADVIAGLTLVAYLAPAGIGDASLAGLPPESGLYACLCAGLVYWLFCSSRHAAVTVTTAISVLVGASLSEIDGGDPERHAALAAGVALIAGVLAAAARALRAGALVNFVSETVMVGFKCGVALHLASTQLPKLLGFAGVHGDFWERMGHCVTHVHETNPSALLTGASALAVIVCARRFAPRLPVGIPPLILIGLSAR